MIGDATLFIRTDEVEQAWQIVDPYLEAWSEPGGGLHFYPPGTWGPAHRRPPAGALGRLVAGARAVTPDPIPATGPEARRTGGRRARRLRPDP